MFLLSLISLLLSPIGTAARPWRLRLDLALPTELIIKIYDLALSQVQLNWYGQPNIWHRYEILLNARLVCRTWRKIFQVQLWRKVEVPNDLRRERMMSSPLFGSYTIQHLKILTPCDFAVLLAAVAPGLLELELLNFTSDVTRVLDQSKLQKFVIARLHSSQAKLASKL